MEEELTITKEKLIPERLENLDSDLPIRMENSFKHPNVKREDDDSNQIIYLEHSENGLHPRNKEETNKYFLIQNINFKYQKCLIKEEKKFDWFEEALFGKINTPLSNIFIICLKQRLDLKKTGLSKKGNHSFNNKIDLKEKLHKKSLEDCNELISMYLWHPQYLKEYLYKLEQNKKVNLKKIEKDTLIHHIYTYVENAKLKCN